MANKPKEETKEEKRKAEKKKEEIKKPVFKTIEGVKGVVRFAENNIIGSKKIRNALLDVKGVGQTLANAIPKAAGIDSDKMIGALTDDEINKLEEVARNPQKF